MVRRRIKSNLKSTFEKISNYLTSCQQTDDDLQHFVWNESPEDIGKDAMSHEGLTMKTKGFSPKIVELTHMLDKIYSELIQDICLYLYGTTNLVEAKDQQTEDGKRLELYLKEEGTSSIDK